MSPAIVCLFVVACAVFAAAGPIKSTNSHSGNQEIASIESASAIPTDVVSKRTITQDLSIGTVHHASELDREVTRFQRVRRSIMKNGKCAQGYVKIGNACMDCKELDLCD